VEIGVLKLVNPVLFPLKATFLDQRILKRGKHIGIVMMDVEMIKLNIKIAPRIFQIIPVLK